MSLADRRIARLSVTGRSPARRVSLWPAHPPAGAAPLPDHLLGDVVAAVIDAGSPPAEALRQVGRVLRAAGDPRAQAWLRIADLVATSAPAPHETPWRHPHHPGRPHRLPAGRRSGRAGSEIRDGLMIGAVADALLLAARSGLPPAAVVRECAQAQRRSRAEVAARRLARLPVLLVLPLGLCLLPASVVLGVAPVVLGLFAHLRL